VAVGAGGAVGTGVDVGSAPPHALTINATMPISDTTTPSDIGKRIRIADYLLFLFFL
jgi:hypothetical protein